MQNNQNNQRILQKFNAIQSEILNIGWQGILKKYHPDNNLEHPESFKLFQLYKEIYGNMKKRLEISLEDVEG